jgi:GTP-binding nuclear protein Ran
MASAASSSESNPMSNPMSTPAPLHFKVMVLGPAGAGKTTFIKRHATGEFTKSYNETKSVEVTHLPFYTSMGKITFDIWDCSGQDQFSDNNDIAYHNVEAAMIMFDVTSTCSYRNVNHWYNTIHKKSLNIPTILCGNKVDCKDNKLKARDIQLNGNVEYYYDISAKSNYNFEKPFLYLARKLLNNANLKFVEGPAVLPPEVSFNMV